ncbi:hypothetical protein EMIT0P176_70171 [Pseudomonas sp. IT-P176]
MFYGSYQTRFPYIIFSNNYIHWLNHLKTSACLFKTSEISNPKTNINTHMTPDQSLKQS